jgi:hypothetical protein
LEEVVAAAFLAADGAVRILSSNHKASNLEKSSLTMEKMNENYH